MRSGVRESDTVVGDVSAICRLTGEADGPWRVLVETWSDAGGVRGRLVFAREGGAYEIERRAGPAALQGRRREDVIAAAHELPERRLRQLLHSLASS